MSNFPSSTVFDGTYINNESAVNTSMTIKEAKQTKMKRAKSKQNPVDMYSENSALYYY